MFRFGSVSASALAAIARGAERTEPTYTELGAALTASMPAGYHHVSSEVTLPRRADAFERGSDGLRQWAAHCGAGMSVEPQTPPVLDLTVAVAAPLGPVTAVAVCRVVAVIDEPDRYGFAYGTLPGHPERGEEAFVVQRRGDDVVFTVKAFSRPAELLPRLGGPVTKAIQRSATQRYLKALVVFVANAPSST